MKHVLVIGGSSYIGRAFCKKTKNRLVVDTVSSRGDFWEKSSFSEVDSVLFCAGIAHRKQTAGNREEYFVVNRDLAVKVAKKAKAAGVSQFIYLSSASVFGKTSGVISADTNPCPKVGDSYGESKLEAEQLLTDLADELFRVVIVRPPMVYGPGCKGNFPRLVKLISYLPVFPQVKNRRSMIFVDTLSEFLFWCVERQVEGVYHPQDAQYMNTTDLAVWIAAAKGKRITVSRMLGWLVPIVCLIPTGQKVFGTLIFDETLSCPAEWESTVSQEEAVRKSVM